MDDANLRQAVDKLVTNCATGAAIGYTVDEIMPLLKSHTNSEVRAVLDRLEAVNTKGMFIDPTKTAGILVADHRIDVQAAIEAERGKYATE